MAAAVESPQVADVLVMVLGDLGGELERDGVRLPDAVDASFLDPPLLRKFGALGEKLHGEVALLRGGVPVVEKNDEHGRIDEASNPPDETHGFAV